MKFFAPDDHPTMPKKLILEIFDAFYRVAQGLPEADPNKCEWKKEYVFVIGLPYLPSAGAWAAWLSTSLAAAKSKFHVDIDIIAVLYAEAWPCSWQDAQAFWGSTLMHDEGLKPFIVSTT